MRIIVFGPSGDEVIATNVVEEAEKILRSYVSKRARVATEDGREIDLDAPPYPETVYVLWPMSGGRESAGIMRSGEGRSHRHEHEAHLSRPSSRHGGNLQRTSHQ